MTPPPHPLLQIRLQLAARAEQGANCAEGGEAQQPVEAAAAARALERRNRGGAQREQGFDCGA